MHDLILHDAEQKELAYRGLAHHYLSLGDAWLAVHAQALSDVYAATRVSGANPADILNDKSGASALAEAVGSNRALKKAKSPLDAIVAIRGVIDGALTEMESSVWRTQLEGLGPFDHFTGPFDTVQAIALRDARLGGLTAEEFIANRRGAAGESYRMAAQHRADGNHWGAIVATYEGDLATFEGWLVERSVEVGDHLLIQTEFKWTLAVAALEKVGELPNDDGAASALVRSRLAWAAGPQDAHTLISLFPAAE